MSFVNKYDKYDSVPLAYVEEKTTTTTISSLFNYHDMFFYLRLSAIKKKNHVHKFDI